ncbi:hypothetical protein Bbelb_405600 [Branchiostoma belcheri]|nr:hypothetical protein Bbelb_405600 [Branchiostoma belcheri]
MASREDLVAVLNNRLPACCSCSRCFPNFATKWVRKRLDRPPGAKIVTSIAVFLAVSVGVFMFLAFQDAMVDCENPSDALKIVFIVFVYLGIPCIAAIAYVIRREPFVGEETDEAGVGAAEGLELSLLFVPVALMAVGCVALDVEFFQLVNSCVHRDRGAFPDSASYSSGMAFHLGRLVLVVSQTAMLGWCFGTRSFARQKVYTVLLFTLVVLADLASWFYEMVDRPSVLCKTVPSPRNHNLTDVDLTCWDATIDKLSCNYLFTVEHCTFVKFQLYCQPLVGTFALLSLATMYYMWAKAREGEGGNSVAATERQTVPNNRQAAAGPLMRFFLVTVAVLSVVLWTITQQATTVSGPHDYYKVVTYYSFKVLYFGLFILSTLAGCVRVQAGGPWEFRSRVEVLLLILSAAGILMLNVRALWGWAAAPSDPWVLITKGCPHDATEGDFGKLQALLMADAVLCLVQLVLQTTFVFSAATHGRLEGQVGSHCGLLCLFNICVWVKGSFVEVQSTPQTTCFTTPVQRASFGPADWNVFVHLLQPVCTFYWLWSALLMVRLVLRQGRPPPRRGNGGATVHVGEAASITFYKPATEANQRSILVTACCQIKCDDCDRVVTGNVHLSTEKRRSVPKSRGRGVDSAWESHDIKIVRTTTLDVTGNVNLSTWKCGCQFTSHAVAVWMSQQRGYRSCHTTITTAEGTVISQFLSLQRALNKESGPSYNMEVLTSLLTYTAISGTNRLPKPGRG